MSASNASRSGDYELQPVKFSRLSRRGVLFGLTASQLVVGIGAVTLVFSLYVGGGASLIVAFPVILFCVALAFVRVGGRKLIQWLPRSDEHTSELQSLMRISYAVFCLKKK